MHHKPEDKVSITQEQISLLNGEPNWASNWTLGGVNWYAEFFDMKTQDVWLSREPMTAEIFATLETPAGLRKSGAGFCQHDAGYFCRPPGAEHDGPIESRMIGGHSFGRVARGLRVEPGFKGAMVIHVQKSHRVLFNAGRTIEVLDLGDGTCLLPQVAKAYGAFGNAALHERILPTGWMPRMITLDRNLVVELPCPARVAIFFSGDIFHGPVRLDQL